MTDITLRAVKGSPLTYAEVDANFSNLKATADAAAAGVAGVGGKANATAIGISADAVDLGVFTGSTIPNGQTAKGAIQSLETAVELRPTITATQDGDGITFLGSSFETVKPSGDMAARFLDVGLTLNNVTPTADGYTAQFRVSAKTGQEIYSPQVPSGYFFTSAIRAVLELQPGTTVQHGSAIDAYAISYTSGASAPAEANAVCYFGQAVAAVDGAKVWGINTATNDSVANTTGAGSGRVLIGWEHDVDVNRTGTTVVGASMIIQGTSTPLNADAYQVGSRGSTVKWTNGYITDDASCTVAAVQIGATATTGSNTPSQIIMMSFRNASNVRHQVSLQASNSALNITSSTTSDGGYIQVSTGNVVIGTTGASTDININYTSKGAGRHVFTGALSLNTLVNAANDTAAASAGVPVAGVYRNGSILMVRVS